MITQKYFLGRLLLASLVALSLPNFVLAQTKPTSVLVRGACGETAGKIEEVVIPTRVLEKEVEAQIYLPPCYEAGGPFPVLYLLHGLDNTSVQWVRIGASGVADALIAQHEIPPLIIVMPQDNMENHLGVFHLS